MKTSTIAISFFYLFGITAAHQHVESTMALDNLPEDVSDTDNHDSTFFEDINMTEEEVDVTENLNKIGKDTPTQRYMRGHANTVDNEGDRNRNLVAKGTTYVAAKGGSYVAAKGGSYVAAKGTNVVPVTTKYYVYTQEKKRPRPYYGKGKGGGYYGGYGGYGGYYDSYGYGGYGGYGGGYYSY